MLAQTAQAIERDALTANNQLALSEAQQHLEQMKQQLCVREDKMAREMAALASAHERRVEGLTERSAAEKCRELAELQVVQAL